MGVAFLGIVGVWALIQTDTVTGDDIRWLMPIPWVVAGVVGLAATAITGSRRLRRQADRLGRCAARAARLGRQREPESPRPEAAADLPKYPETSQTPEEQS